MTAFEKHIDFKKLTPNEFEELCFELILKHGFSKVIWRQGGADNGRDIEAISSINNSLVGIIEEKYFFECKKYENGVPPAELNSKIAWADAEKPQHLVFIISSYLSNNARTWIEKIELDKSYKIHVIESAQLCKILLQHDELIAKYFIVDKYLSLLNETIDKWVLHHLTPNFYTYYYLLENLDKKSLSVKQIVFLFTSYYVHYSRLEEIENEIYHGIDISEDIIELVEILKVHKTEKDSVLLSEKNVDTLSSGGYLNLDRDDANKYGYDFISSEILINSKTKDNYKLGYYLFKRLSKTECIEILLFHNSNLEYKIRFSDQYTFDDYIKSVQLLNMHKKYEKELIEISELMK
jgi:hypothetical protein